jgi:hypothetical protein
MPFLPIRVTPVIRVGISVPNDTFLAHGPCRPGSPHVCAFSPFQPCLVQRPSPHSSRSRAIGYGPQWTQASDAAKQVVPAQRVAVVTPAIRVRSAGASKSRARPAAVVPIHRLVDSGRPSPLRASGCGCAHGLDVRPREPAAPSPVAAQCDCRPYVRVVRFGGRGPAGTMFSDGVQLGSPGLTPHPN